MRIINPSGQCLRVRERGRLGERLVKSTRTRAVANVGACLRSSSAGKHPYGRARFREMLNIRQRGGAANKQEKEDICMLLTCSDG